MSTVPTRTQQDPGYATTSQIVSLPLIPELFDPNFLDVLLPEPAQNTSKKNPKAVKVASNLMMDALQSTTYQRLTANGAAAFNTTRSATLDAFNSLGSDLPRPDFNQYLKKAWEEDPDSTLRIIWNTRSIHDGKSDRELFYRAFGWLLETHPRTAIANLHCLIDPVCLISRKEGQEKRASHGYWKDLLNILALATVGELNPETRPDPRSNFLRKYCARGSRPAFKDNQEQEEWSREQRIKRSCHAHDRLTQMLRDKHYLALYVAVARLFAGQLARDCEVMHKIAALPDDANKEDRMALMRSLTLALKWAPTPGGSHDRITNISSAICLLLCHYQVPCLITRPLSSSATNLPAPEMHPLRRAYQKFILTRGRRHTCVTETLMSSNRWSEITYPRVPSISMNKHKERFFAHDPERFSQYIKDVELGKKRISGATLLPHLLAMEAYNLHRREKWAKYCQGWHRSIQAQIKVVDAQWATLVSNLREAGQLDNCIAVCDVSGSMGSLDGPRGSSAFDIEPIWPALSLSLLVARLASPPFNDSFITFSATPKFVTLDTEPGRISLGATIKCMSRAKWGANTNFSAVFLQLILPLAIKHQVPKDQMIKRIFVFSDMQFDEANPYAYYSLYSDENKTAADWNTNHEEIAEAYADAGYDVPQIVYWDLSRTTGAITAPVTGEKEGVALLSGYSPSMLKLFMDADIEEEDGWEILDKGGQAQSGSQQLTPVDNMKKALGMSSYDGLVVVD